jgi:hypothetical protein
LEEETRRLAFFLLGFLGGLCCGGLFATTSTARSKRDHASECSSVEDADFAMQLLSRVRPNTVTNWGQPDTMARRPQLAIKIAHCIAQWSENEVLLGGLLAFLLQANQKAAAAMYSGVDNRAAQLRMITAAAEATLPTDHFEVIGALLSAVVRPAMKERDKLAHWTWGYSDDLPDALLTAEPSYTLGSMMVALDLQRQVKPQDVPTSFDEIYVVRDGDLTAMIRRGLNARDLIRLAMATVWWDHNLPEERAERLRQLSNAPQIRSALDRAASRKNQEAQQPSPPPEPNGKA